MKRYSIIQRYKSRGNMTWYGRISEDGLVRYVSLKVNRKSEAMEWLNYQNSRKFLPESMQHDPNDVRISVAFAKFMDFVSSSNGDGSLTFKAYNTRIGYLVKWAEENDVVTMRELTNEKALTFSTIINNRLSPKTAREVLRVVKQFCKWAANTYEIVGWSPFMMVNGPKLEKRKKDFWTDEQIDKILDAAPTPEFRIFWSLMAFAGLRQSEACSLGPKMLEEPGKLHFIGKGNKEAFLPISERLATELKRYGKIEDEVLNKPIFKYSRSNKYVAEAVTKAGIKCDGKKNNHRFRHSFASNLIRAGVNIKAVQELMRHENIQITLDTYSHLLQEDLRKAANALK